MTSEILTNFDDLNTWGHSNQRAPHKPLLVLYAHIRWHQAGGPDIENNGLALCVLHHKTFDLGAFTLSEGGRPRLGPGAWHKRFPRNPDGLSQRTGSRTPADRLPTGA